MHQRCMYGTRQKNDANIRNAFPKCACSTARAANRKVSSESQRFFPKKRKASYEECWVRTHIWLPKCGAASITDLLGLHSCLRLCLKSCVCNGKAEQQHKGFCKTCHFQRCVPHTQIFKKFVRTLVLYSVQILHRVQILVLIGLGQQPFRHLL